MVLRVVSVACDARGTVRASPGMKQRELNTTNKTSFGLRDITSGLSCVSALPMRIGTFFRNSFYQPFHKKLDGTKTKTGDVQVKSKGSQNQINQQ